MCAKATLVDVQGSRSVFKTEIENPIRIGIVGLGHRSVGNAVKKCILYDEYDLVSICDIRPELTKKVISDLKKDHDLTVSSYTSFDEMLEKEQLDAVAVQIDATKQAPLACQAMEAGCHVMMEVPMTYTIEDCWRLVTTVERTGKIFLLMEQMRYAGQTQAWREIVQSGLIGKPIFCEGEYFLHAYKMTDAYFQDANGRFYTPEQAAKNPDAKPTWRHLNDVPYWPHDISPLLHILDDRVKRVVGMATREQSYRYPNLKVNDLVAALMHTDNDVVLRLADGHTSSGIQRAERGGHWLHVKGTEGELEWKRSDLDKCKFWSAKLHLDAPLEAEWTGGPGNAPPDAKGSGHGDLDFYVFAAFADAVLRNTPLEFDIYKAVEITAPAILTAKSIREGNTPQEVPDFRPGPNREKGKLPEGGKL